MNASRFTVAALLAAFTLPSAFAQTPPTPAPAPTPAPPPQQQDKRGQLRESMKARYPLLAQLRDAGKIGETRDGDVKLVKASHGTERADAGDASKGTVADVVAAEMKDRRELYELLSKELKTSATEVARQNGLRNLENAKPDHWIEVKGQWVQRKTVRTVNDDKVEPKK